MLASSLDVDETLRRIVRLAVPRIACLAMIDLKREDGRLQRVAFGHVHRGKQTLLERAVPFDPEEEGLVPLGRAAREGVSLLV